MICRFLCVRTFLLKDRAGVKASKDEYILNGLT